MKPVNIKATLRVLLKHEVEFIVVGMASAVLQGAPSLTFDVDIVHARTDDNVERLLRALDELDAIARGDPRRIRPGASHLIGPGHILLETSTGDLDCLGTIDGDRVYADLLPLSVELKLGGDTLRVVKLAELIEIKRRAGRPKDLAVIPVLEATRDEVASG